MEYKKIKQKKIYEEVAEALLEMIKSGQLKPGDRLDSVEQLATSFQVGRSAIREALSALRAMGLIEIKHGEGTFVKSFDANQLFFPLSIAVLMNREDVTHLLEVRKILESGNIVLAARNRDEKDLRELENILQEMKAEQGNGEIGEKADYRFHKAIATATHNPLLSALLEQVSGLMMETQRETRRIGLFSQQKTSERLYEEHARIYAAIESRDEEEAQRAMLEHLIDVEKLLKSYLY